MSEKETSGVDGAMARLESRFRFSSDPIVLDIGAMADEIRRLRADLATPAASPAGHVEIEHDGFKGDIIGYYTTREGKRGVVVQQDGTRVVHVYGEKWIK